MTESTMASYVREIRPRLKRGVFQPARSRLWWLPVHLSIVALCISALQQRVLPWFAAPLLSLVIGMSYAGLTFLAHETLHGAVVRGPRLRYLVGWIGFAPFVVSPRLWIAWHDRVHHANANLPDDPDMYPTLAEYHASGRIRFLVNAFSLGCRRWRGGLSLILGFTVQSAHQLIVATTRGFLS